MTIDINKRHSGGTATQVVECIDRRFGTWRVRTDFKEQEEQQAGRTRRSVTFVETEIPHKPTMAEVREFVFGVINAQTDEKILSGMTWGTKPVWLSEENQKNFSEAQRVAQMMPEAILPVTFKLGENAEGEPVYHEFTTAEELTQFYLTTVGYINACLQEGWQKKDTFDFTPYELILNPVTENEPDENV